MTKTSIPYDKLIGVLVVGTPFVTMLNGLWLLNGLPQHGSPGEIIGGLELIVALVLLARIQRKSLLLVLAFLTSAIITTLFEIGYSHHIQLESAVWFARILFTICLFRVSYEILKPVGRQQHENLRYSLYIAAVIIAWSLLVLRLLHYGFQTYSTGTGFKGLFYGQNDLTATLSMLLPLVVERALRRVQVTAVINLLAVIASMLLIGTKTALGAVVLNVVILAVVLLRRVLRSRRKSRMSVKRGLLLLGAGGAFLVAFVFLAIRGLNSILHFQLYYFTHSKNLLIYLLSGRTNTLPYVFHVMGRHPWSYLFGVGFQEGNNLLQASAGRPTIVEFDPISVFFAGGLLLFGVVVAFFYPMWRHAVTIEHLRKKSFWLTVSVAIGVFASVLAGHVVESALAGTYFSVLGALWIHDDTAPVPYL